MAQKQVKFWDISGNDDILVTALSGKIEGAKPACGKLLFESQVVF